MTDFIDIDAIFNEYAKNVSGRKATYVLPPTLLDKVAYSEIDTSQEIEDIIAKQANLQDLFSPTTEVDGLPVSDEEENTISENAGFPVEDTTESSVGGFEPALASKVLALATRLDSNGFVKWAAELDSAVADFAEQPMISNEQQAKDHVIQQLDSLVTASLDGNHWLLSHAKDSLKAKLAEDKLVSFAEAYHEMMDTLGKISDLKEYHERMAKAWPTVQNLSKQGS